MKSLMSSVSLVCVLEVLCLSELCCLFFHAFRKEESGVIGLLLKVVGCRVGKSPSLAIYPWFSVC